MIAKTGDKPTIADVDGTIPGRAVLISVRIDQEDPEPLTECFEVRTAADVTDEVMVIVQGIVEGWYNEGNIDWENVWDRMEKSVLEDGRGIDMGTDANSPAIRKIKREIYEWRKLG